MKTKNLSKIEKFKSAKRNDAGYHFKFPKRVEFYDNDAPCNSVNSEISSRYISSDIQAEIDQFKNMLVFSLNPDEFKFSPSAFVKFYWHDVDFKNVELFYINNDGEYISPKNTYLDLKNRTLIAKLKNFTRFAVGTE
ncbi:MAG: hypothetical protein AMJ61_00460 [Desulfobacterales bacterium SG8_35_2]|nr:MAG: hypothetical protein AMJ61_00460 [Desulfobacterales bacterium SG8_35_2]